MTTSVDGLGKIRKTHCKYGHGFDGTEKWQTNWKGYKCRVCRECAKLRQQRKRASPGFNERAAENTRRHREKLGPAYLEHVRELRRQKKEWLDSLKIGCARCSQTHVACLEFHHRDPSQKDFLLSVGVAKYSLKRLQTEVDKCEIICSNCHRIHHWNERQKSLEGD
jgi:hypothetical protein